MDQSLRTVATQLLNVTNTEEVMKMNTKGIVKTEQSVATTQKSSEKSDISLIKEVNKEISNLESMGVSFGRPINSKFGYFETSHPGHAMAMTEEELEREMSTTRLMTAYKNHPTTTGGISTWILLNPPSTTVKSVEIEKRTQQPFQTEVRLTVKPSSSIERVETISPSEKIVEKTTPQLSTIMTTEKIVENTKKPMTTTLKKIATTLKPERTIQSLDRGESSTSTTLKMTSTTIMSISANNDTAPSTQAPATKKNQSQRTTPKVKVTTPKTTSHSKLASTTTKTSRPNQQNRPKPTPTRRTTIKPEILKNETVSIGKIEKVTFKPVQMITTPKNKPENTEKPIFVTKIKASVLMDSNKTPTTLLPAPTATTLSTGTTSKLNLSGVDLVEVPVRSKPVGTKVNNVLKVQLKKPIDETTKIEIDPVKVNAPILKIEKIDKDKMEEIMEKDTDDLNNSRIDLKFDFNPELTRINVETQTELVTTSTTVTPSTTTKRPRHNSKRKKNKVRRRKPSSTSVAPSSTTVSTVISNLMETSEGVTDSNTLDNAIQESKIAPETKIATNATKTKKKQPQKAIGTQIYNFLSREVMPSFGVMSLVGLGLGIASYFLYPFGGTIARRNYEVEPNYKYNLEEYGGNYGQSEEEVLAKVLQGMTNHENKYPEMKDLSNSYYHYQRYDGAYDSQTTKKADRRYPPASTSPLYRPIENTLPSVKYRNTDFRYPEAQTTPVYYDRKHPDLTEVGSANRQFVVGNVPKEYSFDTKAATLPIVSKKGSGAGYESTESDQTQFERDVAQSFNFAPNLVNVHTYDQLEGSTARPDDAYEEIEITPTAVAVEHGPRALKVKRAIIDGGNRHSRFKRESVIQVIPSKHELEEEEKEEENEEDLSNEILDIIDLALPATEDQKIKNTNKNNEVEDLEAQRRKQQEEANTRAKESTTRTFITRNAADNAENVTNPSESTESPPKVTEKINSNLSVSSETSPTGKDTAETRSNTTTSSSKDTETTTVEWFESSTTNKPTENFSLFSFVKKVAEIKFRLGLTILKHASEGFARYLGHVQKRINGEE